MLHGHFLQTLNRLGLSGTAKLLASRRRLVSVLPEFTQSLTVKGYPYPFHFRHATTDKYVVLEVLVGCQYKCVSNQKNVFTVVDAGANIGTAAVYFLNAYPQARVIAIESDCNNFEVLKKNLSYYGDRAVSIHAAVWHKEEQLAISRGAFRDGGDWSFQVKALDEPGALAEVQGTTISCLMGKYNIDRIDLLKIDIEGAERDVFERDCSSWVGKVGSIAIELHDQECRSAFLRTVGAFRGSLSRSGEVTVWTSAAGMCEDNSE